MVWDGTEKKKSIVIAMATCNGEKYLEEQLASLEKQTCRDFLLAVHDDGSTDDTREILRRWEKESTIPMAVFDDGVVLHGSSENFVHILKNVQRKFGDFSYYMFCDQDDVWNMDKIELTLRRMKKAERKYGGPVLIHTDLEVVDENLTQIAKSYIAYRSINPRITALNRMLIQNNVTGCTMMWNRELNAIFSWEKAKPALHDWWISLCAVLFGKVSYLDQPTIRYRQHGGNVVGATKVNSFSFILLRLSDLKYVKSKFHLAVEQASSLLDLYGDRCTPKQREYLGQFADLYEVGKVRRLCRIIKYRFYKHSPVQVIGELLFI